MFTYEYRFYPRSFDTLELDDFIDNMQWFLSSLCKNGQILSGWQNTVRCDDYFACRFVALEMDSLSEKYGNCYTSRFFGDVADGSAKPPELIYIGENYDVEDCCTCETSSHYVLYTNCMADGPPVVCGDCKRAVPLYRFPKTYDDSEYYNLLGWQKVYQSCDRQFLEGIGERHGYRMMHDPASALSREALGYCRMMEEKVGRPFYYFLFNYYGRNKPCCPGCGEPWLNLKTDGSSKIHYDYVCHHCRLVSDD